MRAISFENKIAIVTGAGWYGRAAIMTGGGISFRDFGKNITAEEIRDHFDEINDLDQAKQYESAAALYEDIFL